MNSVWQDTARLPSFGRLEKDIRTDVLVIGGGMAGLLCTYLLTQASVDCALAEAETLCGGVTKNTTAKITSQHGLIYDGLIRCFGEEKALLYLFDFEEKASYVYSKSDTQKLERELSALRRLGFPAEYVKRLPLPFPTAGAVKFPRQAQMNPLKFAAAVSKGLPVYEHTPVRELAGTTAVTDGGVIHAKKIIAATHFPFLNKHGLYFLKMYQHRSYVIALENAPDVGGMYVDEARDGLSLRNYKGLLLLGGGGHRTGKSGGGWRCLRDFAGRVCPGASEKFCWAAQDCMTLDGVPYIGRYALGTENLYVATGFQKWGMTSSMVSAMLLTQLVQKKQSPLQPLFSPSRSMLRPQLAINGFEAAVNLLTPGKKRCPHMGCALKWNPEEHSWDCPCHGSRFTEDGRLIDNPAAGGLKK